MLNLVRAIVSRLVCRFLVERLLTLEPRAPSPAARSSPPAAGSAAAVRDRPFALGLPLPIVAALPGGDGVGQASNGDPMAPTGISVCFGDGAREIRAAISGRLCVPKTLSGMRARGRMVTEAADGRISDPSAASYPVAIQAASEARGRESPPAPTAGGSTTQVTDAGETVEHRSLAIGVDVSSVPSLLDAMVIVQPETVIRWHRCGFRAYWRWKSRYVGGRPRIDSKVRALIRRMSRENRCGAHRGSTANC
jgi:hypothetical protein